MAITEGYLRIQNTAKTETITTISKGCQPLPRVKDNDNNSSSFLNISLFESQIKKELISEYGQTDVDYAVREAVKHNKNNLAYIEGICKKRKEKVAIENSKEEARQKKLEQDILLHNQRQSGTKLNLLELVYGKSPDNPPLKEINSG